MDSPPETPGTAEPPPDLRRRRTVGLVIWAVVFAVFVGFVGIPTSDPLVAFGWLWLATIAWRSDQPWRKHLLFLRDWLPVVALLEIYNVSRGVADDLFAPHVTPMIRRRRVDVRLVHRRQDPDDLASAAPLPARPRAVVGSGR